MTGMVAERAVASLPVLERSLMLARRIETLCPRSPTFARLR
ncbi:hypothetical protein A2U01_0085287 [Trifolium medium]|uniref:Uncharacterized protein n=1 Tax=Trifolium medium TaxID=97028 RepID=A0A392TUR7_9FABA|nr:hypothetical protein [Trifolium medium]